MDLRNLQEAVFNHPRIRKLLDAIDEEKLRIDFSEGLRKSAALSISEAQEPVRKQKVINRNVTPKKTPIEIRRKS